MYLHRIYLIIRPSGTFQPRAVWYISRAVGYIVWIVLFFFIQILIVMVKQYEVQLPAFKRGFHLITHHITDAIESLPARGLVNVFLHHTSAGLIINENADASVPADLNSSFDELAPERMSYYTHILEGDDDMPAHIKSALTGVSLTIPVSGGRMKLGTWQGIFLCEFRNHGGPRRLTVTVYG